MATLGQKIRKTVLVQTLLRTSKKIVLPGFDGMPLYDVGAFFVKGMTKGTLAMRASSMSFSFLLAVFPSIIFLFTLIPYIPIPDFQDELLTFFKDLLPKSHYETVRDTLEDIIKHQRGGLLSFGFLSALYFSTNGINAMMQSFNLTHHSIETRSPFKQRLVSIQLTIIIFVLVLTAVGLIVFSEAGIHYLVKIHWLKRRSTLWMLNVGKWIIIVGLFFAAFSFLYYYGPAKKRKYRFVSAGSTLATLMSILLSIAFAYFVNNFGSYNKVYGSIGTLIVIMLWMNFNSFILLIGFELNASIDNASVQFEKENKKKSLRNVFRSKVPDSP